MSRSWLTPPGPETDPRETLRWVRRAEVVTGLAALALGLVLWNEGWWHWVLIGMGLLGLSPWPGAQAVLRKAERGADVLVTDPARRRRRGRRAALIQVPLYFFGGGVFGYVIGGWWAAIIVSALVGASAALGALSYFRSENG